MPEETQQSYELKSHRIEPHYAMAGVRETWLVTFSGLSLPEGSVVRIRLGGGRDNKTNWTRPQTDDPSANEYVTAECSGRANLRLEAPPWEEVTDLVVDMTITGAALVETEFPVHTVIRIGKEAERRRNRAAACHASQTGGEPPRRGILGVLNRVMGTKDSYMRAEPPVKGRLHEKDLFEGVG